MADTKVTALTAASTLANADIAYIVQGGVSKRTTMAAVWAGNARDGFDPATPPVHDGVTNDRPAFVAAEAYTGDKYVQAGTHLISTSITLTGRYIFAKGAIIKPASGQTVTFNGSFTAGPHKAFDLSAGGLIRFGAGSFGDTVDAFWFGAVGDGTTDDYAALNAAAYSIVTQGLVRLDPNRIYGVSQGLVARSPGGFMSESPGYRTTGATIKALAGFAASTAVVRSDSWDTLGAFWHYGTLRNINIDQNSVADWGVAIHQSGVSSVIDSVACFNIPASGRGFIGTGNHAALVLRRCSGWNNTGSSVALELTTHPTLSADGSNGVVWITDGFESDNGVAGSPGTAASALRLGNHTVMISGLETELHTTVIECYSSTRLFISGGNCIRATPASGDFIKITGGAPAISINGAQVDQYTNIVNNTVTSDVILSLANRSVLTGFTYNLHANALDYQLGGRILRAGAVGTIASRIQRFASGSTAKIQTWETQAGVELASISAAGALVVPSVSIGGVPPRLTYPGYRSGRYYGAPGSATGLRTFASNDLRLVQFECRSTQTFDQIGVEITTAGGAGTKYRLGIWLQHTDGMPGALLLDAGQIAGDGALAFTSITISQSLTPGLYYLGCACQSFAGSPAIRGMTSLDPFGVTPQPSSGTVTSNASSLLYAGISGAFGTLAGTANTDQTSLAPAIMLRAA